MAGLIKLSSRRLSQNILRIGIRTVDDLEVRGISTSRISRQVISRPVHKLSKHIDSILRQQGQIPNSSSSYAVIRGFQTTFNLLQSEVVKVPPFADSVSEGDVKFTCKVGDAVNADQVVMEIETDKTAVGVPAPFNGVIEEIYVKDGDTVKAGQQLFKLKKGEGGAAPKKVEPAAAAAAAPKPPSPKPSGPTTDATKAVKGEQEVSVPPFADSVSEGDIKFSVKVGDIVKADQVVMEIETDKTTVGVPAPFDGVILEIFVKDSDTVKAGQKLFKLGKLEGGVTPTQKAAPAASSPSASSAPPPPPPMPTRPIAQAPPPPPPPQPRAVPPPPPPSPTGPAARIPAPPSISIKVPPEDYSREITGTRTEQRVKMNRMRQKIAQRLKDAQNVNAMLTTFNEIDMSSIMDFRKVNQDAFQKKYGIKFGFMSIFLKASAYALQDQPVVNAVIDGNEIVYRDYVDISVAVATPKGLVVPVIRNVESMNYADIEIALAALGEKARKGKIAVEDMDGGTFTISNGGVFGSLMGTPIINPPQSAILGMHGVFERPIAVKGQVVIRPMMYIALTYDHRLIDGREAVMFLRKIKAAVEDPRIIVAGL